MPVNRTLPDARELSIGGSVHDPTGPVSRLLFNVLAMGAEIESDLIPVRAPAKACRSPRPKAGSFSLNADADSLQQLIDQAGALSAEKAEGERLAAF
jgi:hypothetical protein